ncbi:uncharacterized protein M6D78_013262 [Vipera latastei]
MLVSLKPILVFPKATLTLPKATLALPKATLALPKATLALPKATLLNKLRLSLLNHLSLLSHPPLAHNSLTMEVHLMLYIATMVQFHNNNNNNLDNLCLLPMYKMFQSPLLFLVLNILLALPHLSLHNLPLLPLFYLVMLNFLVIPPGLPLVALLKSCLPPKIRSTSYIG